MTAEQKRGSLERSWSLRRAILTSALDAESKLILMCIDAHAPDWGAGSYPGYDTMALAANCSARTAERRAQELEKKQLIECVDRGGGRGRRAKWRLNVEAIGKLVSLNADTEAQTVGPNTDSLSGFPGKGDKLGPKPRQNVGQDAPKGDTETLRGESVSQKSSEGGLEGEEGGARAREANSAPRGAPEMPTLRCEGRAEAELDAGIWERARAAHGSLRLLLDDGIRIDVFTAPNGQPGRRLLIWREGELSAAGMGAALRDWGLLHGRLFHDYTGRAGENPRRWAELPAPGGYPWRAVQYVSRER